MNCKLKTAYKIMVVTFGTLTAISCLATKITFENKAAINGALGVTTSKYIPNENAGDVDSQYFKSAYNNLDDEMKYTRSVGQEAEQEGAVLLKNDNSALPLTSGHRNISLVGISSVDPVYGGTGSGAVKTTDAETMKDSMTAAGFTVNSTLWDWYTANKDTYKRDYSNIGTGWFADKEMHTNDAPWADVNTNCGSSFSAYGDAAILTISRVGGEGYDMSNGTDASKSKTTANAEGDYLAISDNEKGILKGLKALKDGGVIKKIVVLVNSANALETSFIDNAEYGIDAAMWIGSTGHKGLSGVANLLAGDNNITPSGCLSDTYFTDNIYNPTNCNFGDYTYDKASDFIDSKLMSSYSKYVVYQEGIYKGYKYTETRYEDKVLGRADTGTFDYTNVVDYPFGFGLNYTTFTLSNFKVVKSEDNYTASVKVTNSGSTYSGKKVVQLYAQKPYTTYDVENGIEKSAVDLVGYTKTKTLAPGESQDVEVTIKGRDFASYDANKAKTYVLDEGTYYLTAAEDSHAAINNILAAKGKTTANGMTENGKSELTWNTHFDFNDTKYSYSDTTNKKITNLFDHADINKYDGVTNKVTYMSRNNWTGTYPDAAGVKLTYTQQLLDTMNDTQEVKGDSTVEYPTYGASNNLQLIDLRQDAEGNKISYDSKLWDDLLDELTWDETLKLVSNGLRLTTNIDSIGKITTRDHNGPTGCTQPYGEGANGLAYKNGSDTEKTKYPTCFPCNGIIASTFSSELAAKVGDAIGEDALWAGYSGLYGPCSNIHRSPYGGRTFEYYSEDATLSGKILAAETKKIQEHGCYVYNKHFALNDQESNRSGVSTWVNEQTIREEYLKAFDLAIEEGGAMNVMSSFNRIGAVTSIGDYNLQTAYLHGEVGMEGFNVTDYYGAFAGYATFPQLLMAGVNLPDGSVSEADLASFNSSYKTGAGDVAQAMRESAHRILYTVVHSNAMNGITSGGRVVSITPAWQIALTAADWTFGVLTVASAVMLTLGLVGIFPKKEKPED